MTHHPRDHGTRDGLQVMCEGGGQANAPSLDFSGRAAVFPVAGAESQLLTCRDDWQKHDARPRLQAAQSVLTMREQSLRGARRVMVTALELRCPVLQPACSRDLPEADAIHVMRALSTGVELKATTPRCGQE